MRKVKNVMRMRPTEEFFADALKGNLASYSWIDPKYYPDDFGPAND
jgi:hypothetical protein